MGDRRPLHRLSAVSPSPSPSPAAALPEIDLKLEGGGQGQGEGWQPEGERHRRGTPPHRRPALPPRPLRACHRSRQRQCAGLTKSSQSDPILPSASSPKPSVIAAAQDPIEDQPYWHVPKDVVGSAAHIAAAKDAAAQGMVLLRNEKNTLPLSKAKTTVAIGPMAVRGPRLQFGTPASVTTHSLVSHICIPDHAGGNWHADRQLLRANLPRQLRFRRKGDL